jgi:hypothetical protein
MDALSQGDFGRVVRGGKPDSEPERVLQLMWTYASSAAKRVHRESADAARTYLTTNMRQFSNTPSEATARSYMRSFETYVKWDDTAYPAEPGVQVEISFASDGMVRGRADMVFVRGAERCSGRLLLWDHLPMDRVAAEIIALPACERWSRGWARARSRSSRFGSWRPGNRNV